MTLKEQINRDYLAAFKSKNVVLKNLLSTIKGEIQNIEKILMTESLCDSEIIRVLIKYSKNIKENLSHLTEGDALIKAKYELSIVEGYLPKQMSNDEIQSKVNELIKSGASNLGQIMKEFSNASADKKVVSEIAKKSLQNG